MKLMETLLWKKSFWRLFRFCDSGWTQINGTDDG